MSLICGRDRNDESRNAIANNPGAPRLSANAYIQAMKDRTRCMLGAFVIIRTERVLAVAAAAAGLAAWIFYFREDLILSHYDAKAHLVVARRVLDSITPGWQQIGAVWLPLPHLIHLFPTQVDVLYRTGAFASMVSIGCLATSAWAAARLILLVTASRIGAATAALLMILNPNLLYLHTTPMTEPLLVATSLLVVLWLYEWVLGDGLRVPARLGWALVAAVWTRYEAWAIVGSALVAVAFVLQRRGLRSRELVARVWAVARWPGAAVLVFLVNSRITVGAWFVTGGFYV